MKNIFLVFGASVFLVGCSLAQQEFDGKTAQEWKTEYEKMKKIVESKEHQEFIFNKKQACQKDGEAFHDREFLDMKNKTFEPQFKYSEELNTCLYRGGIFNEGVATLFIKDIYSNTELYTNYNKDGEDLFLRLGAITLDAFLEHEQELGF